MAAAAARLAPEQRLCVLCGYVGLQPSARVGVAAAAAARAHNGAAASSSLGETGPSLFCKSFNFASDLLKAVAAAAAERRLQWRRRRRRRPEEEEGECVQVERLI